MGFIYFVVDAPHLVRTVRNIRQHIIKRKPFLKPYESVDNVRFAWLDKFLQYFKSCKKSIKRRNVANYTKKAKSKMFISWQNYESLQITVLSFKEVCKF